MLEDAALDAVRAYGLTVELNTAGFRALCGDAYPSLDLLKRCRSRDIPVTLSADAHRPEQLLAGFDRGLARLREAGYASLVRFRERTCWSEPLADALRG
jgi:histidinol-phosphatase (PHP family)